MIVADTNVVSEFMKDSPDPMVLAWAEGIRPADLTICVVTVMEIERGLGLIPDGRRRGDLELRWGQLLVAFGDAIIPYDVPAARRAAAVLVASQARGRQMSLADAQIAGICLTRGHTLATRNIKDFEPSADLEIVNPFRT